MNYCECCGKELDTKRKYCDDKCQQVERLRNRAIKFLLEQEERANRDNRSSPVVIAWIKNQLEEIQTGKQDEQLYKIWQWRQS